MKKVVCNMNEIKKWLTQRGRMSYTCYMRKHFTVVVKRFPMKSLSLKIKEDYLK